MHESILKCLQIRRKYHSVSIKIRGLSNVVRLREESRGLRGMVSCCILEIKSLRRLEASQRDVPIYNDCCLSLSRNELGPESIVNLPSCVCVQFRDYGDRMSAMISFDKRFELNIQIHSGRAHGDLVINDSPQSRSSDGVFLSASTQNRHLVSRILSIFLFIPSVRLSFNGLYGETGTCNFSRKYRPGV